MQILTRLGIQKQITEKLATGEVAAWRVPVLTALLWSVVLVGASLLLLQEFVDSFELIPRLVITIVYFLLASMIVFPITIFIRQLENSLANEKLLNRSLSNHRDQMEAALATRTAELQKVIDGNKMSAAVTEASLRALNLEELLSQIFPLMTNRFAAERLELYLNSNRRSLPGLTAVYQASDGIVRLASAQTNLTPALKDPIQILGRCLDSRIVQQVYVSPENLAPQTSLHRLAAGIPVVLNHQILGVFILYRGNDLKLSQVEIGELGGLLTHIASTLQKFNLYSAGRVNLQDMALIYQASHAIGRAASISEALEASVTALQHSDLIVAYFRVRPGEPRLVTYRDPLASSHQETRPVWDLPATGELENVLAGLAYYLVKPGAIPPGLEQLVKPLFKTGSKQVVILPVWLEEQLLAVFALGSRRENQINELNIQPYASLVEFSGVVAEKITLLDSMVRRIAALQSIGSISRALALETNLDDLYRTIHMEIQSVMGNVDFLIAVYQPESETIQIPYAVEAGKQIVLPELPLGEGLTSILIRTRQPLLISKDAPQRAQELGAKVFGEPAQSWLGVPMLTGGEILGALIIQDTQNPERFDEEDQSLLATLAAQVGISIRNINLYQESQQRFFREQALREMTGAIWASTDPDQIVQTTLQHIGRHLKIAQGTIDLYPPEYSSRLAEEAQPGNSQAGVG